MRCTKKISPKGGQPNINTESLVTMNSLQFNARITQATKTENQFIIYIIMYIHNGGLYCQGKH